jgi:hypothetical protein
MPKIRTPHLAHLAPWRCSAPAPARAALRQPRPRRQAGRGEEGCRRSAGRVRQRRQAGQARGACRTAARPDGQAARAPGREAGRHQGGTEQPERGARGCAGKRRARACAGRHGRRRGPCRPCPRRRGRAPPLRTTRQARQRPATPRTGLRRRRRPVRLGRPETRIRQVRHRHAAKPDRHPRAASVHLDPVQFDYRASGFRVIDNGHTVQVNVGTATASR